MTTEVLIVGGVSATLEQALREYNIEFAAVDGRATGPRLVEAGITAATQLVVTDLSQATAIPIAKDHTPSVTVITYDDQSLPEFATAQTDFALDPALVSPELLVTELLVQPQQDGS